MNMIRFGVGLAPLALSFAAFGQQADQQFTIAKLNATLIEMQQMKADHERQSAERLGMMRLELGSMSERIKALEAELAKSKPELKK